MRLFPRSRRGTWLLAGAVFGCLVGILLLPVNQRDPTAEKFAQIRDNMTLSEISELLGSEAWTPCADFVDDVPFRWETADGTVHILLGESGGRPLVRRKWYVKQTLWRSLRNRLRQAFES
jgi:hypothetical protein